MLDVDNGPDFLIYEQNRALYTEAGLAAAYARLTPAGTLAIWCQSAAPGLRAILERTAPPMREHFAEVTRGERRLQYAIYTVCRPTDFPGPARQECGA